MTSFWNGWCQTLFLESELPNKETFWKAILQYCVGLLYEKCYFKASPNSILFSIFCWIVCPHLNVGITTADATEDWCIWGWNSENREDIQQSTNASRLTVSSIPRRITVPKWQPLYHVGTEAAP